VWSDAIADRLPAICDALLPFLADMTRQQAIEAVDFAEGAGEVAGVTYHVRGSGPPVVLLPLNLAASQWDPLLPALAERYTTITLGGPYLGMVATLETRIRGGYGDVVRGLAETAGIRSGDAILEVGCGSGAVVRWLARHTNGANPVTAVDINRYLLGEAAALAARDGIADRIDFREGSATALPFEANTFDVTLSSTVMEEVDADVMLAELIRVTKPGGRVGVVVRSEDLRLWMDLPVRPELRTKIEAAPGAGVSARGCADGSLYRRFRAAGLVDLKMGPVLAINDGSLGAEWLSRIGGRIVHGLSPADAAEVRAAFTRAAAEGTLLWAEPYHRAVGTKR
jgi:SAM-dependent methyltransferase